MDFKYSSISMFIDRVRGTSLSSNKVYVYVLVNSGVGVGGSVSVVGISVVSEVVVVTVV